MKNFKQIEPTDRCPAHIKDELVSEIESIKNGLQVVELYVGDFLNVISALFTIPVTTLSNDE